MSPLGSGGCRSTGLCFPEQRTTSQSAHPEACILRHIPLSL
jgi:hypothetical protein